MLESSLREFLIKLASLADLTEIDRNILRVAQQQLDDSRRTEGVVIDSEYLLSLFLNRWKAVKDTSDDYTICYSLANQLWIAFAKELENKLNLTYLQLLFPDVINLKDPNGFSVLAHCRDTYRFYLADDDKTLCRISTHVERMARGQPLSTYERNKFSRVYPLSLKELLRIRKKTGFEFPYKTYRYTGFWDYLKLEVMPGWKNKASCPRSAVAELYKLAQLFFADQNAALDQFREQVVFFSRLLREFTPSETNALYGQIVYLDKKPFFLVDILLDMLTQNRSELVLKMAGVAGWLRSYDASFVLRDNAIAPAYRKLRLAPALTIEELINRLNTLRYDDHNKAFHNNITTIIQEIQGRQYETSNIINAIKQLYMLRWSMIMGTQNDYTLAQTGANDHWILLAQQLSGAGLINENYYLFLMPTLKTQINLVSGESILSLSLRDCILDEKGEALIYLPDCVQHLKSRGTFYIPGEKHPRPLTPVEQQRLSCKPKYKGYGKALLEKENSPLSIETVLALRELVVNSFFPEGLKIFYDYDEKQLSQAEKSFDYFFKSFYGQLSLEDKQGLDEHIIIYNGTKKTFSEVLTKITKGKCVAVACQWLAQLVIDYAPWITFGDTIERKADIGYMREASQKRLLRNDGHLIRHLQVVYASLLTHPFTDTKQTISAFEFQHSVPEVGASLFALLHPLFKSVDFRQAPATYAKMMALVNTELATTKSDTSWVHHIFGHQDTSNWLAAIADFSLFKNKSAWFNPYDVALSLNINRIKTVDDRDRLIQLLLLPVDETIKAVRFNVYFLKRYPKMSHEDKAAIQSKVENWSDDSSSSQNMSALVAHIIKRLACEGAKNRKATVGFYGQHAVVNQKKMVEIKRILSQMASDIKSIGSIIDSIEKQVRTLNTPVNQSMQDYWLMLTNRRLLVSNAPDCPSVRNT